MSIQTSCPICNASYNLPDEKEGKTVRCKNCNEPFTVRDRSTAARSDKIQAGAPRRDASSRRDDDEEDDDRDEREDDKDKRLPRKSKKDDDADGDALKKKKKDDDDRDAGKKKKKDDDREQGKKKKKNDVDDSDRKKKKGKKKVGSPLPMILMGVAVLVVLGGGGVGVYFLATSGSGRDKTTAKKTRPPDASQKADPKAPSKADPKAGPPKQAKVDLPADDPVRKNFELLQKESDQAVRYFHDADPNAVRKEDPQNTWRGDIVQELEKLLYKSEPIVWETYAKWARPADLEQMTGYIERAPRPEYKKLLLKAVAEFQTDQAAAVLVSHLVQYPEKFPEERALSLELLKGFNLVKGEPNADKAAMVVRQLFPYVVYHADCDVSQKALDLLEYYKVDIDHPFYKGPVSGIKGTTPGLPRLPPLQEKGKLSLDTVATALKTAKKDRDGRLGQLMTLNWLQEQRFSEKHCTAVAGALDPLIIAKEGPFDDYLMSHNALLCMERWWCTKANLPSLEAAFKKFPSDRPLIVSVLKKIPDALPVVIRLWPTMDTQLQKSTQEYLLSSVPSPDAKRELDKWAGLPDAAVKTDPNLAAVRVEAQAVKSAWGSAPKGP